MPKSHYKFHGLGKRKTAVARVYMNEGSGSFVVNDRQHSEYFPSREYQDVVVEAIKKADLENKLDIKVRVAGGGISAQAEAIRHGVSRALLDLNPELRPSLKAEGYLTRDAREKERKKYGQPGARKKFQYSKR